MAEIYDLAVKLSVQDGLSAVVGKLMRDVPTLGKHFDKLEGSTLRFKAALTGVASLMAGGLMFKGLERLEEAGEHLVHVKTAFEAALPTATRIADMAKITSTAYSEASKNMQSTARGNIEALHDLYTVTQSVEHATKLLPAYNTLASIYASVKDQHSIGEGASGRNISSAVRGFELTGRNTEEALATAALGFGKTTIALGSKAITGGALLTQLSNAGDSRYGWSDDFLTKAFPAMMATGLQNRTGQAVNAFSNNLYGGVSSSVMQADFQEKWGLHKRQDELLDEKGHFKGFKVGSMWHADEARDNPLVWANKYRDYLRDEKHVDVDNTKTMQNVIGEIGRGNKLLKAFLDEVLLPQTNRALNKEIGNINSVGNDAVGILGDKDPGAIHRALRAKWQDTLDTFGEQLVQPMLDNVIKPMTVVLKDVSQWAAANPETVSIVGKGLLVASAGLTGLGVALTGGALLAAIGPAGWLIGGTVALGAAFAAFRPEQFQKWWEGFKMVGDGILHFDWRKIVTGLSREFSAVMDLLPSKVSAAIYRAIDGIAALISGKFGEAFNKIFGAQQSGAPSAGGALGPNDPGYSAPYVDEHGVLHRSSFRNGASGSLFHQASFGSFSAPAAAGGDSVYGMIERAGPDSRVRNLMKGMFEGESDHRRGVYDHARVGEDSVGPFQLNKHGGLGALFQRETGLDPADPRTVQAQANWVYDYVARKRGSLSQWRGLSHGIQRIMRGQVHPNDNQFSLPSGAPPTAGAPPHTGKPIVIENKHYLDGKMITASVSKHRVVAGRFPTSVGGPDTHGSFVSPGTPIADSA